MTHQEEPARRVPVTAQPGSRLEELLASYEPLKAAAEEAASRFKAVTDALKAELPALAPEGTTAITLSGAPGLPVLHQTWVSSWKFDVKQLKADDPVTYVRYASKGGHWELRAR
jgi:hypothetical protein